MDRIFTAVAGRIAAFTGQPLAFIIALSAVVVWAVTGPMFGYSETWQLVINTGTTIVTFLVVFLLQRSQNKESRAVQLKLNEIVAAISGASNRLIGAEQLSEAELANLAAAYQRLVAHAASEGPTTGSRTVEDHAPDSSSHSPERRPRQASGERS